MGEYSEYKFGVRVDKHVSGCWSFGSCFSHAFGETYLYINFLWWTICIGWLHQESDGE